MLTLRWDNSKGCVLPRFSKYVGPQLLHRGAHPYCRLLQSHPFPTVCLRFFVVPPKQTVHTGLFILEFPKVSQTN